MIKKYLLAPGPTPVPLHFLAGRGRNTPLLLSQHAPWLAVYLSADRKAVHVLELADKAVAERCKVELAGPAAALALSPDGRKLAVASEGKRPVRLWDLTGPRPNPDGATGVALRGRRGSSSSRS